MTKQPQPKKPVHREKSGAIEASIWENDGREGSFYSFTIGRLYKQGDDWKTSHSFGTRSAADVAAVATLAARWIAEQENPAPPRATQETDAHQNGSA